MGSRTACRGRADELLDRFGVHENVVETESPTLPYPLVLAESLRRIGADLGVEVDAAEATEFGESVGTWPAFADSAGACGGCTSGTG